MRCNRLGYTIYLVALRCIHSNMEISFISCGFHNCEQHRSWDLTNAMYNCIALIEIVLNVCLISPNVL